MAFGGLDACFPLAFTSCFALIGCAVIGVGIYFRQLDESVRHAVWLEGRCKVLDVGTKTISAGECDSKCRNYVECNGMDSNDAEWQGPCGYPCCGFNWYLAMWKVSPVCGPASEGMDCFGEGKTVNAYYCTKMSMEIVVNGLVSPSCNASRSEEHALKQALDLGDVDDVVPCFHDEAKTEIKMSRGADDASAVGGFGSIMIVFGAIFASAGFCATCCLYSMMRPAVKVAAEPAQCKDAEIEVKD
eukprot:TRINITY_DN44419_c0_g1_i1.p1 TRINITY_DN44419_c0_g1~~TRINITY_DN44419_c0_g1_i1.p1  ORF type:complete len:244 (+),score=33.79 TRINITY_DN44419_c0_g1_i1:34-765(+)